MLSYELCLKLKDAGFPQSFRKPLTCSCGNWVYSSTQVATPEMELVNQPTLSELIDACNTEIVLWNDVKWFCAHRQFIAHGDDWVDGTHKGIYIGQTPEEAVANLWFALREK